MKKMNDRYIRVEIRVPRPLLSVPVIPSGDSQSSKNLCLKGKLSSRAFADTIKPFTKLSGLSL